MVLEGWFHALFALDLDGHSVNYIFIIRMDDTMAELFPVMRCAHMSMIDNPQSLACERCPLGPCSPLNPMDAGISFISRHRPSQLATVLGSRVINPFHISARQLGDFSYSGAATCVIEYAGCGLVVQPPNGRQGRTGGPPIH